MYWESPFYYLVIALFALPVTYFGFIQVYYVGLWKFDWSLRCSIPCRQPYIRNLNDDGLVEGIVAPFRRWYTAGLVINGRQERSHGRRIQLAKMDVLSFTHYSCLVNSALTHVWLFQDSLAAVTERQ